MVEFGAVDEQPSLRWVVQIHLDLCGWTLMAWVKLVMVVTEMARLEWFMLQ